MLSLLYVTNIFSHHQLPVAQELASILGINNFHLAVTEPVPDYMVNDGWLAQNNDIPWLLSTYDCSSHYEKYLRWWNVADVVVTGNRDIQLLQPRVKANGLTFYMSERWWKPPIGRLRRLHPGFARMCKDFFALSRYPNFYYLPMGYYAAHDLSIYNAFKDRIFQWAYFTEISKQIYLRPDSHPIRLLWVGRMLSLKRVDTLLHAAKQLLHQGIPFTLDLVGDGPKKKNLLKLCSQFGLTNNVQFHPPVPAAEVRDWMRRADIYILPSNGYEGWGAVVNEAMSEGCLVVASQEAGSARVLIKDGENGLLFRCGDHRQLASLLARAITDDAWRKQLSESGYRTIHDIWSPQVAAQRLVTLANGLLGYDTMPEYDDGPCKHLKV